MDPFSHSRNPQTTALPAPSGALKKETRRAHPVPRTKTYLTKLPAGVWLREIPGWSGWYSYRASKTALNQLTKNMSIEFSRKRHPVSFVLLHPGTVVGPVLTRAID